MRALISVFNKEKIVEFAKGLRELGWEIISTGGTYKLLKEENIDVISVEEVTEFPEILDGRVKTLNPKIHGGILYKRDNKDHEKTIKDHNIKGIDMVVNSLYPFEETLKKTDNEEEIIEMIDIGGPSMIRAAAKNFKDVLIVTSVEDYDEVLDRIKNNKDDIKFRQYLAAKAFELTSNYDFLISSYLYRDEVIDEEDILSLSYINKRQLRYGENPHQEALYYEKIENKVELKQLHGKELSYNNFNDIYAAVKAVKNFHEPACVAIKHTNPCGIAIGENSKDAYLKAYSCDRESIFGGIVAFNEEVDGDCAKELSKIFLEVIIAPKFTKEALEVLEAKKNIRLIELDVRNYEIPKEQLKETINGILVQQYDDKEIRKEDLKFVTDKNPTDEEIENLLFAYRAVKSVASNGVVMAKDGKTISIGQGQTKRAWAVEESIARAEDLEGAVFASDGFFFVDTMELLHKNGVNVIIQPGGSVKDEEVIKYANENNMAVVFTGIRHFRH